MRGAELNAQSALETITALSTMAAAGFAAWAAWISRSSAKAANAAVEEARKARLAANSPRLVLSPDFLDFQFQWPHPETLNGEAVFRARRHWRDTEPVPPSFSLSNFGSTPALEAEVIFTLEDPNGPATVPEIFEPIGIFIPKRANGEPSKSLTFRTEGGAIGIGMLRRETMYVTHCPPAEAATIPFPDGILMTLFMRGLQRGVASQTTKPIQMSVSINAHTVDGEPYSVHCRYEMEPFWTGSTNPVMVAGRFTPLPIHPTGDHLRTALI
jgi:hypothetical protein